MAHKLDRKSNYERLLCDGGGSPLREGTPEEQTVLSRRSYIELGATTAAALSMTTTGRAESSAKRQGIEFEHVLDAVDDLGMDPTGREPIDDYLGDIGDDILLQFPDGQYRFNDIGISLEGETQGLEGIGENASFVAPDNNRGYLLKADRMNAAYIAGIQIDQQSSNTCTGLRLSGNRVVVENLDVCGGCTDQSSGVPLLSHATISHDGQSLVENVVSTTGCQIRPVLGRPGVFIQKAHEGTVTINHCDLRMFSGGAVYTARHTGRVHVRDSYFENNASSIRLRNAGSSIARTKIVVDDIPYPIPPGVDDEQYRLNGISIARDNSTEGSAQPSKYVQIQDTAVRIGALPISFPALVVSSAGSGLDLFDSRIEYENDSPAVILVRSPGTESTHSSVRPLRMYDTTVTGDGQIQTAIEIENADGSIIRDSRIRLQRDDANGVTVCDSEGCAVERTEIAVAGEAVVTTESKVEGLHDETQRVDNKRNSETRF